MNLQIDIIDVKETQHTLIFKLLDNEIVKKWVKKIKHLQNIPLDDHYTNRKYNNLNLEEHKEKLISLLNKFAEPLEYTIKNDLNQSVCNQIHTWIVKNQYNYNQEHRDILHQAHRLLHSYEQKKNCYESNFFPIGWGEKEGLLESEFKIDPYRFYQFPLNKGDLCLNWTEFGKKPYTWFQENKENVDKKLFFEECKPHQTFRANFEICTNNKSYMFDKDWLEWWEKNFRKEWIYRYGSDWDELKHFGGILLGNCVSKFKNFEDIDKVLKITLI